MESRCRHRAVIVTRRRGDRVTETQPENDDREKRGSLQYRLKEVRIEFFSPFLMSERFHCPMQGPQALASSVPPIARATRS